MGLKIYLLGQFKLDVDDQPIELSSRPAQSLLAYLALNAGVAHRRERLASLLWPEANETNARSYLRQALWRIRKTLEGKSLSAEDYLQVSDISLTFNAQSDYWLDVQIMLETPESHSVETLIESVRLYHGELLPGFYDEWVVLERDRLEAAYHHKMNLLLERLIQSEQWDEAIFWSEEWIKLGHAPEPAFRALMQAHTGLGDLGMVTAAYQRCAESLKRELNLEPSAETKQLYEHIRKRESQQDRSIQPRFSPIAVQRPAFLDEEVLHQIERPVFVARQRELEQLDAQLAQALKGQGRVIFVTGEAGSGKTALIQEFTRRAQDVYPDLVIANGNCNAHTGIGDPYLPFREIMELLTGDVEARWAAGAITGEHARLLWNTLPITAQAMMDCGVDLIDTFVPAAALLERAMALASRETDWLKRLEILVCNKTQASMIPGLQQSDLFEQYTRVLQTLARQSAVVLMIDDLQWGDTGSVGLLFHLGRHLVGSRILIVGAYRPEEVALGREGERHPLDPVLSEFQRQFGDITVDLSKAESREFVESVLDSERNRLSPSFRQMLYQQTRGQPLFTVELLRGMQERGDIIRDQDNYWVEGSDLDWETLPARVEAVIGERIKRLIQPHKDALRIASVEGEEFSAEVVARVLGFDERQLVQQFSSELDRRHRLIRAHSIERHGSQRISRYRFRHYLMQKYLYDNLDQAERAYLHEDVGNVLENLFGEQVSEIAVRLARHFQEANISEKAVHYLLKAGDRAMQLSSYQEALKHLTAGLAMLKTLPASNERAQQELNLHLALGMAWTGARAFSVPEVTETFARARELCQQLGDPNQLCRVLGELSLHHYVRAEHQKAYQLGEESLSLAQQVNDPLLVALGHWYTGIALFCFGEFSEAHAHFQQVINFYNPEKHHQLLVNLRGSDSGLSAFAYDACCLWCLGYPDQAQKRGQEALALAQETNHPFSSADVICYAGCLFSEMRQDGETLNQSAEQLNQLASEKVPGWLGMAISHNGIASSNLGQFAEGIAQIQQGIATNESIGAKCYLSVTLGYLAEAQAKAGQLERGLDTLDESLTIIEQSSEHNWEAELYRMRAEILLMQGRNKKAEASLLKAIEIARRQNAKSWELRAATDLACIWKSEGKIDKAYALLAPVYEWFTEGSDTPDLISARELLEGLA